MAVRKERKWRPFPFEFLWWELFWWTGKVVSVHPRLKTWKKSCLLILPLSFMVPLKIQLCSLIKRQIAWNLPLTRIFLLSSFMTEVNDEKISTYLKSHAYMLTVCVCVCVWDSEAERLSFSGDVLEQFIDIEFLYPLDPHFQWSLMYTFVMRQGY